MAFTSCQYDLSFIEPQPTEDKDEVKFKNKFLGSYLCIADSSILTIGRGEIIQEWCIETKLSKAQIDTIEEIELNENGDVFIKGNQDLYSSKVIGDTIIINKEFTDTLFKISENTVLRYFKVTYFLNYKISDSSWIVKTLVLGKGGRLSINSIRGGEEEIRKIRDFTVVQEVLNDDGELLDYSIKPSKRELKEILNSDLFIEGTVFQKLKS